MKLLWSLILCITLITPCESISTPPVLVLGFSWLFGCGGVEFAGAGVGLAALGTFFGFKAARSKKDKAFTIKPTISMSGVGSPGGPRKDDEGFFEKLKKRSDRSIRTKRFGRMYRDPETGLWWSKDLAQHGGSRFKVFKETSKSFEWVFNADNMGNEIIGQHKGPVGMSISFKNVIFKS